MVTTATKGYQLSARTRHKWGLGDRLKTLRRIELFGLVAVGILLVLAVIGPWIAPYPTMDANATTRLLPPNAGHWLGTDENGMDILSRILAAPRVDVSVAFIAIGIAFAMGTALGVFAGFFERSKRRLASMLGELILRVLDVVQAFPVFILAMVLVAIRGASTQNIIIAVAFVNMPGFVRITRAEILTLRERAFTEAVRSIGATDTRIAFRHLLPNALPPLITQVSVNMGFAILLTAGLSFVGAGVSPPTPELGGMISTGATMMILGQWWPSLFPGIALALIVFSFAMLGEAVQHLFEPHSHDVTGTVALQGATTAVSTLTDTTIAANPTVATRSDLRGGQDARLDAAFDHSVRRPSECLLAVDGLSVDFGDPRAPTRVLEDISLWVSPGETFGIVGEAGSGKSVLARVVLRLLHEGGRVVSGSVRYRDRNIFALSREEMRRMRAVEFSPILPSAKLQLSPVSSIGEMMVLVYRSHVRADRRTALARAVEALRLVGIQDPERRLAAYPHELSGGMAQRVCIALALLHHPRLLIADDPTASLDVTIQRQVLDQLVSAASERGAAQLIVTRDLGIVAQYCQRMAVMHSGRIVESGYTADVFKDPQHPFTRELLASVDVLNKVSRTERMSR